MRTMVAELAKNPRERMSITESFVREVICSFQTKKMGRIPKDQSVTADIAAWA